MAIDQGIGEWGEIQFESGLTPDAVSNIAFTLAFDTAYTTPPLFLASLATYNCSDNAQLRYENLSASAVDVLVEEDTTRDSEVRHTDESVSYLVFGAESLLVGERLSIDFSAEIHGLKWNDTDGNGEFDQDTGEDLEAKAQAS